MTTYAFAPHPGLVHIMASASPEFEIPPTDPEDMALVHDLEIEETSV